MIEIVNPPKTTVQTDHDKQTLAAVQREMRQITEIRTEGFNMHVVWNTCNDDHRCDVCRTFHNCRNDGYNGKNPYWLYQPTGEYYGPPPAHSGCRCWIGAELPD